ncbi:MAG: helix-turn-helix domain-containing protein [Mailhella sp.]|nr:helix-turn-helix domain-containing protein [Mailhella sp.]
MRRLKNASELISAIAESLGARNDSELADRLGVSRQAISQVRKKGQIPDKWIIKTGEMGGMSLDELCFDEHPEGDFVSIPLVEATLAAGGGSFETDGAVIDSFAFKRDWVERKGRKEDLVLMRASGDSMEPAIFSGDMLMVNKGQTRIQQGMIYAVRVDDALYVKQIELHPGDRLIMHSYNPKYSPIEVDLKGDLADTVRVLGRVVWRCHDE